MIKLIIVGILTATLTKILQLRVTNKEKINRLKKQMKTNPRQTKKYMKESLKPAIVKLIPAVAIIMTLRKYYAGTYFNDIRWIWIYVLTILFTNLIITLLLKYREKII